MKGFWSELQTMDLSTPQECGDLLNRQSTAAEGKHVSSEASTPHLAKLPKHLLCLSLEVESSDCFAHLIISHIHGFISCEDESLSKQ